jgi:hypothetical protein
MESYCEKSCTICIKRRVIEMKAVLVVTCENLDEIRELERESNINFDRIKMQLDLKVFYSFYINK